METDTRSLWTFSRRPRLSVYSMAVDWIHGNVYVGYKTRDVRRLNKIEVIKDDGSMRKTILATNSYSVGTFSLVLDPRDGYVLV